MSKLLPVFRKWITPTGITSLFVSLLLVGCDASTPVSPDPGPHLPALASPPAGTTSISVGAGGLATIAAGSTSGKASVVIVDQDQLPIMSTDHLNSQNVTVEVGTSTGASASKRGVRVASTDTLWSFQPAKDVSITFQGGGTGDPVSYVLTLDRSGSMSSTDIDLMERAAEEFVRSAATGDEGAIINFGSDVVIDQSLTSNASLLITAINNPSAGGYTALYDSIGTGVSVAKNGSKPRKAVICMTDGGENASSQYTSVNAVVTHANSSGVSVHCVGLGLSPGSFAEQNLKDITAGTGGFYYFSPTSADLADLYDKISLALSNTWAITFNSPVAFVAGTQYAIRVTVTYPGGITDSVVLITTA